MSTPIPEVDPLATVSTPAVSFKDKPVGTVVRMVVSDYVRMVQSRDFDTGEPKFWPANADGTKNPVMSAVVAGEVDGEQMTFWARKPSSMFTAIATAQREAGQRIAPGGILEVAFVEEKPNSDRKKAAQKIYKARYTPGAAPATNADPFASGQPAAAPAASAAPVNDPWAAQAPPPAAGSPEAATFAGQAEQKPAF